MEQKHIVIDARIRPSSTGRYVDRLLEHLQKIDKSNRYTVLLEPKDEWQPTAKNFAVLACPYKKFSFNPIDQITYARFLNKLKPDLVHFAMTPQEPVFYRGTRITTTHDLTMLRFTRAGRLPLPLHWLRMAGYRFLFWASHRASRAIIVPTEYVAQDLAKLHPFAAKKTVVTLESSEPPLQVESRKLKVESNASGEDRSGSSSLVPRSFLLHVGSPFPHKNIERLVKAFTLLKEQFPELKLVLAGKKEYYFEQLAENIKNSSVESDIIIPGFVSDAELKWLYENASAYVLPSLSEGFGLPGLEAMVHGTPLASSSATCLPEVYGDAAIYFDPLDYKDMASKVAELLSNKALQKELIEKGHKQVKKYSWSHMAEQTLEVYESALNP